MDAPPGVRLKPVVWVAVAFGAGIATGMAISRRERPESVALADSVPISTTHAVSTRPIEPNAFEPAKTAPANASVPVEQIPTPPAEETAAFTGYSQPIEVGKVFRNAMSAPSVNGAPNQLADAHRALEREERDDSWSYPLEAELQNSLLADASADGFTIEHVECRATACEVRLSGKARQFEAISHWPENGYPQTWSQRLQVRMSSTIGNGEQVDRLIILKKPPPPKPD
jgi:pimeloyl-ACP methyl ester carboxylesterase